MRPLLFLILTPGFFMPLAQAQEEIDLEGARIFGNKDLPNITYIVPWKDEQVDMVDVQPVGNLFDEALAPIDRDVFLREVEYYDLLQQQEPE